MISKDVVERYLQVNGVHSSAPDDEIKEVLFSAKWHQDDIETALMVLREDTQTHQTHVDSLHKVFHSDERLQPETISALLGIDVELPSAPDQVQQRGSFFGTFFSMIAIASILSFTILLATMWYLEIGLF